MEALKFSRCMFLDFDRQETAVNVSTVNWSPFQTLKYSTVLYFLLEGLIRGSPHSDGNKSLYLVFVGVVFLSILDCF
jgi:hypothetical protein